MSYLRENSKGIAAALSTLLMLAIKPFVPDMADPAVQPAIEAILGALFVAGSVWFAPSNRQKDGNT